MTNIHRVEEKILLCLELTFLVTVGGMAAHPLNSLFMHNIPIIDYGTQGFLVLLIITIGYCFGLIMMHSVHYWLYKSLFI